MALDQEREHRLKRRVAESVRRLLASEKLPHYLSAYSIAVSGKRLPSPFRADVQRLQREAGSQRAKRNPIAFVERRSKQWLEGLGKLRRKQADNLLESLELQDRLYAGEISPSDLPPAVAKQYVKLFASLAAGKPGRRRMEMYIEGHRLRRQGKTLHEICKILTPGYGEMSAPERRAARDRMDKGIGRATQFATQAGPTQSRK